VRVVALVDLTEIKRLEGARRDFIAAVSHELKTPLTVIQGFTETLLDGAIDQPEHARDFVAKIGHHAERLAALVRDVLTLSRLERGSWDVRPQDADLVRLGREMIEEYQPQAAAQRVTLELIAPERLPATTDPELIRHLVGNLLSNAIRYNRPGGNVRLELGPDGAERIRIAVADTGIGIPPEHRERIFERFYRVDTHRSRDHGGTGLGLAIVKHLGEVLEGTIDLISGDQGSTFTVSLPRIDRRVRLAAERPAAG
jgi:two-component system phosphate regulon sensor histidine kinase PhoR